MAAPLRQCGPAARRALERRDAMAVAPPFGWQALLAAACEPRPGRGRIGAIVRRQRGRSPRGAFRSRPPLARARSVPAPIGATLLLRRGNSGAGERAQRSRPEAGPAAAQIGESGVRYLGVIRPGLLLSKSAALKVLCSNCVSSPMYRRVRRSD
jgi:hypothetical protein